MKKYLLVIPLVFLLCFVVGCQDKAAMAELEEFKAQAALEEQNKEIANRLMEELNKGNVEIWRQVSAPDLPTINVPPSDGGFSDEDYFAKGDKAISRYVFRATHSGDIENIPATGKKLEARGIAN
jgi:predicted ester cyclase